MRRSPWRGLLLAQLACGVWESGRPLRLASAEDAPDTTSSPPDGPTDLSPDGACKEAIQAHCSKEPPGDGRLAHCIREVNRASAARQERITTSQECIGELTLFFRKSLGKGAGHFGGRKFRGPEPIPGLRKACSQDATTHCPNQRGIPLLTCLISHKADLVEGCKGKVAALQLNHAEDPRTDPRFREACTEDLNKIGECARQGGPGAQKACLQMHKADLSNACANEIFRGEQEASEDVRLNLDVFTACKVEVTEFCANKEFGEARILHCLWESSLSPKEREFSPECRTKVDKLTIRSLQDYRLDFGVRRQCADDIAQHCGNEQSRVDNMTLAELFGGMDPDSGEYYREGSSGQVLHCLKKKMGELSSDRCKSEMMRVVRIQAMHIEASPILYRKCKADIETHCKGLDPTRLHVCLRQHLTELSEECKSAEILQGKVESTDMTLKPALMAACSGAIKQFCPDVPPGNAALRRCVQDHMKDSGFPVQCKGAMIEDMQGSGRDWRMKWGISTHCRGEMTRLCPEEQKVGGGAGMQCLRSNFAQVRNPACKHELQRSARFGSDNLKLAPSVYKACEEDAKKYCSEIKPGGGKLHACLLEHKKEVSKECAKAEFAFAAVQLSGVSADDAASRHCASAIKALCPDVDPSSSKMWQCLEDKRSSQDMPHECAEIVDARVALRHSEFHLDSKLSQVCSAEAKRLCPDQISRADAKDFSSDGAVITCLGEKAEEVKASNKDCFEAVARATKQRVQNVARDPVANSVCQGDVKRLCSGVKERGRGDAIQSCLQDHQDDLSPDCRKKIEHYMALASSDIRLNTTLQEACKASVKKFCGEVPAGEGRVIECLIGHMQEPEMDAGCRGGLQYEQRKRSKSVDFMWSLKKGCASDLKRLEAEHQCGDLMLPGSRVDCLTTHVKSLKSPACVESTRRVMQSHSADLRNRASMLRACKGDIKKLCHGVSAGEGRWHMCLRKHFDKIKSDRCKAMVEEIRAQEEESAYVNYAVQSKCKHEQATYCSGVHPGDGRLAACLALHKGETGFSKDCANALLTVKVASKGLAEARTQHMVAELSRFMESSKGWMERHGLSAIVLAALGTALLTFALSYWFLKRRFKKVGYVVSVPDSPDP